MLNPLVSIVIPTYNREKIIRETLDCAISQDYANLEIIVVDNCSTDNTFNILKEYQDKNYNVKIYQNIENLGPVRNWEVALSYATGKYIKILWSDDKISKDFLSLCIPILENNSDIGFVYTKVEIFFPEHKYIEYRLCKSGKYPSSKFISNQFTNTIPVPVSPGCAIFRAVDIKSSLIIDIQNPKNLNFRRYGAGNDLLIFLLTANKYRYFYFIDQVCSYFRAHTDSLTIANDLSEYYAYSKHYFAQNYLVTSEYKKELDYFYYSLSKSKKLEYICYNVKYNKNSGFLFCIWRFIRKLLNG